MKVAYLEWDSIFFGLNVYAVHITDSVKEWKRAFAILKLKNVELAYINVEHKNVNLDEILREYGAALYDEKVTGNERVSCA